MPFSESEIKLIVTVVGFLAAVIGFMRWWLAFREDRRNAKAMKALAKAERRAAQLQKEIERKQITGLQAIQYVLDVMRHMAVGENAVCDRVIMFNGHNSGGLPDPTRPYYVSAVYSATSDKYSPTDRPEARYKLIPVDHEYIFMLLRAHQESYVRMRTSDMPECVLRDFYQVEGVTESAVFFIRVSDDTFIFMSTALIGDYFSDDSFIECRRSIDLIRASIEDWSRSSMQI